jgi:hypothetical protein
MLELGFDFRQGILVALGARMRTITSEAQKKAVPTIDLAGVADLQLGRTDAEPMIKVR